MSKHEDTPEPEWKQVHGDINPGCYGGIIARIDEEARRIEVREIEPVREHVGDKEAAEVGFPFWTREASFDFDDLTPFGDHPHTGLVEALENAGLVYKDGDFIEDAHTGDIVAAEGEDAIVCAAVCLLHHSGSTEDPPSGWAKDVVPGPVRWFTDDIAGPEHLQDEEEEFREEILGEGSERTAEAWWDWHDADSSRWYATPEEAEEACAEWVTGESDVGPARD